MCTSQGGTEYQSTSGVTIMKKDLTVAGSLRISFHFPQVLLILFRAMSPVAEACFMLHN